jgi:hypothetical protein
VPSQGWCRASMHTVYRFLRTHGWPALAAWRYAHSLPGLSLGVRLRAAWLRGFPL